MLEEHMLYEAHRAGTKFKTDWWMRQQERDAPSRLHVILDDGESIPFDTGGLPVPPAVWIMMVAETMPDEYKGRVHLVMYTSDTYVVNLPEGAQRPVNLEEDFRTNPGSAVVEAITTTIASDDHVGGCDVQCVQSTYAVSDGGVLRWDEPQVLPDPEGAVPEVLYNFFQRARS